VKTNFVTADEINPSTKIKLTSAFAAALTKVQRQLGIDRTELARRLKTDDSARDLVLMAVLEYQNWRPVQ
jgi:hypothetical protein